MDQCVFTVAAYHKPEVFLFKSVSKEIECQLPFLNTCRSIVRPFSDLVFFFSFFSFFLALVVKRVHSFVILPCFLSLSLFPFFFFSFF